jgi:predicted nucleic acid-binding protein
VGLISLAWKRSGLGVPSLGKPGSAVSTTWTGVRYELYCWHGTAARRSGTNIWVSALRSRRGASFRLLSLIGTGRFEFALSTALVLEYEDAAKRQIGQLVFTAEEVDRLLDILCAQAVRGSVFFLWRPVLSDPADDFVLELAVASGAEYLVTYNKRHFAGAEQFGVRVLDAKEFLQIIGEIP